MSRAPLMVLALHTNRKHKDKVDQQARVVSSLFYLDVVPVSIGCLTWTQKVSFLLKWNANYRMDISENSTHLKSTWLFQRHWYVSRINITWSYSSFKQSLSEFFMQNNNRCWTRLEILLQCSGFWAWNILSSFLFSGFGSDHMSLKSHKCFFYNFCVDLDVWLLIL